MGVGSKRRLFRCILATDMARHNEILNKFKTIQPVFDFTNKDHKEVVSGPSDPAGAQADS